jgi:hypothetical protein
MNGESLWPRLAGLPLVIEACEYDRLHAVQANEFERITTHVRLVGAGADGLGEDVSVFREEGTALHAMRSVARTLGAEARLGRPTRTFTSSWGPPVVTGGRGPNGRRHSGQRQKGAAVAFQLNLEQPRKQAKERARERRAAGQDVKLADLPVELVR